MDLKLPIKIIDELGDTLVESTGLLDMASGEILDVRLSEDNDPPYKGFPPQDPDYDFTSGLLTNGKKDVEFGITADVMGRKYSITTDELLELKERAARLFTAAPPAPPPAPAKRGRKPKAA